MGELARKPGAPPLPLTPEELLTTRPGEGFTWMEKHIGSIAIGICSVAGPAIRNWTISRPLFASIYQHLISGAVGYVVADWYFKSRRAQRSEKDAILLHYISLHPEDFPPFERQRYKDVFLGWVPKR